MTDREAMQKALEALKDVVDAEEARSWGVFGVDKQTPLKRARFAITALRERLAQPETIIDKSAAIRIATALGWEPPREEQEQEPVAKWDASAPLVVTPHPAFQATQQRREWVGLTAAEFRKVVDGLEDLEDCWVALEHALKEKNT